MTNPDAFPHLQYGEYGGEMASFFAAQFYAQMPPRIGRYILPNMRTDWPAEHRVNFLRAIEAADASFFAWIHGRPFACCWIAHGGARLGFPHFFFTQRPGEEGIALAHWLLARLAERYSSLLALIAKPFRGARQFARKMGFVPVDTISGAFLANFAKGPRWQKQRYVDGELLKLEFGARRAGERLVGIGEREAGRRQAGHEDMDPGNRPEG